MKKNPELLAPGGDIDSIKAAIAAGADAVYCGLNRFNARNRAENLSIDDLIGVIRLAHRNDCQVFLTLNIILIEAEISALVSLLNKIVNIGLDGVIVQDFGLLCLLNENFKSLKIHASTQLTTHNEGQVKFLSQLSVNRVNLCRELNLNEITQLSSFAHAHDILTEVFVHGSHCLCFSGICYMSSVQNGTSGNRGRCGQPCREQYITTSQGKTYPLNLKDISTFFDLRQLVESGVDSLKIEGRIKKFHYVYAVVDAWRKQLRDLYEQNSLGQDDNVLRSMFNRGFTSGFLQGNIHKDMFIDNPRDNSARNLAEKNGHYNDKGIEQAKTKIYNERSVIIQQVEKKIVHLNIEKIPIEISISGKSGTPLKVSVKTAGLSFNVFSDTVLVKISSGSSSSGNYPANKKNTKNHLGYDGLQKTFRVVDSSGYHLSDILLEDFDKDLFLPFKEIKTVQRAVLVALNDLETFTPPIAVPRGVRHRDKKIKPSLSVLIASRKDVYLCDGTGADCYFLLPDCLQENFSEYRSFFLNNPHITPVFPSILIGEHFHAAVDLLQQIQPQQLVSNNTGIAYYAWKMKIPWIAGPYLNLVNSYGLKCLKEYFNCSGAFISNELSQMQINVLQKPEHFNLFYSIYHPLLLMTSRQCLFHHVSGCAKECLDEQCIPGCKKSTTIHNLRNETFYLTKELNMYNCIYNGLNFLNTDIVADIPDKFTSFFIDLRDIKTNTAAIETKLELISMFSELLHGTVGAKEKINDVISPVTNSQYMKGI
ncbi:MAG: U32 family peptidase [Deltaproteobacteria bacterium]|nr:U32 family peptidase [Deltaproteobacteria bacterium]